MTDELTGVSDDGIRRSFDEHYDSVMDVEQDPTGATWAIHKQANRIEELEEKLSAIPSQKLKEKYNERVRRTREVRKTSECC